MEHGACARPRTRHLQDNSLPSPHLSRRASHSHAREGNEAWETTRLAQACLQCLRRLSKCCGPGWVLMGLCPTPYPRGCLRFEAGWKDGLQLRDLMLAPLIDTELF